VAKKKFKIRKTQNGKSWRDWFSWAKRSQTRSAIAEQKEKFSRRIKIAALSIFLPLLPAGLVVGFFYLEKYVHAQQAADPQYGPLVFVDAPAWAHSEAMKKKLADIAGKGPFELKEGTAKIVQEELSPLSWLLYDVKVRTTTQNVMVDAKYREPEAVVKSPKGQLYYVALLKPQDPLAGSDNAVVVLEYIEVEKPPMPEITGFAEKEIPSPGKVLLATDISAALQLLSKLKEMDDQICSKKPLREEIAAIDVTNFDGRKTGPTASHIILKLKDGTPVYWGAALGQFTRFFEASDAEKLTLLYTFYQENKYTLLGQAKTIELFQPKSGIPRPQ
jgi:hypothetical protein